MADFTQLVDLYQKCVNSSTVSITQPNAGDAGGSKSPAVSRTESMVESGAEGVGEAHKATPSTPRSHIPHAAEMRKVFQKFDRNQDGLICINDLSTLFERLGMQMSPEAVQSFLNAADQNSDGEVDFEEFYALYSSLSAANFRSDQHQDNNKAHEQEYEENLKKAFQVFDKDNDGCITAPELKSTMLSMGMREGASLIQCERMINNVATDGSGKVRFQDFKKLMSSDAFHA